MNIQHQINVQVTYQIEDEIQQTCIKQDDYVYQYFSKVMQKSQDQIIILIDGKVQERQIMFSKIFHLMQDKILALYDCEKLVKQLEDADLLIQKQKYFIEMISKEFNLNINYDKLDQNFMNLKFESQIGKKNNERPIPISENDNLRIQKFIQFKQFEIKQLEDIQLKSCINFDQQETKQLQQHQFCKVCNLEVNQNQQTDCEHFYHQECFETLVQTQLHQSYPIIRCLCNKTISKKKLFELLGNQWKQDLYFIQILQNQVISIKNNCPLQIRSCQNKTCCFFYIQKGLNQKSYCPLCLQIQNGK